MVHKIYSGEAVSSILGPLFKVTGRQMSMSHTVLDLYVAWVEYGQSRIHRFRR